MKFIINLAKNYIVVCKKTREKTNAKDIAPL